MTDTTQQMHVAERLLVNAELRTAERQMGLAQDLRNGANAISVLCGRLQEAEQSITITIRETVIEVVTRTVQVIEIERNLDGLVIEPECPECHAKVGRPKCLLELGGFCPRHALREAWIRARVALDGTGGRTE